MDFIENTRIYVRNNHLYFYRNDSKLSTLVDNFVDNLIYEGMILIEFWQTRING